MTANSFGKLLSQGLKCIAALDKSELTDLQQDLGKEIGVSVWTIYKWRKGTSIPNDDRTIAMLARACVERGRMDRQWLSSFLTPTIYSSKQALLDELCPEHAPPAPTVQNLPRRQHTRLIGREQELQDIRSFLSPRHRVGVVCISGGGGIGKTALALEVAHACHEASASLPPDERFDAIIWATAKNVELLPGGLANRQPTFSDLDGIYRALADMLDLPVIFRTATQAEKNIVVSHFLAEKRVLLMLDNLEDVDDQELMIFLRDLPAPSKAIVTTRHRIDVAVPVHLHSLSHATAAELVELECERYHLPITPEQVSVLLQRTGGLPLAIIRTISRMAWRGSSVEMEIRHLEDPSNAIYDFCFSKTIALIQLSDAYQLFMALALFTGAASREAVGVVAGFANAVPRRDEGLSDLEVLSLCDKNGEYFGLEPLTRAQARAELHAHPTVETEARQRWLGWYFDFTARYGGRDQQEMHTRYDFLEADWENILAVIHWCMDEGRYADAVALWENLRDFTHIYGYWTDRLRLLDWLTVETENRGDQSTLIKLMFDKAFTLTLTGPSTRLLEADSLLERCWALGENGDPVLRARVAALKGSLNLKQGQYRNAHDWLDTAESILSVAALEPAERARERTSLLFDRGEAWLMMQSYAQAQQVFEEMLEQAWNSSWQRSAVHAENWLAHTAILQDDCALGEKYLSMGWSIANRIKEKRLIAYYKRTFAYYYRKSGDHAEARRWAADALDSFTRLGMPQDIREMETLIASLAAP